MLVCVGERSHLFYEGDGKPFKNFEFECDVMTTPGSNAGIFFHTKVSGHRLASFWARMPGQRNSVRPQEIRQPLWCR